MAIEKIDGGPVSQFRDLIKQVGHNRDTDVEFGTVLVGYPALSIQLDNAKFTLDADDVVVPQHLTNWTEKIAIKPQSVTIKLSEYTRQQQKTQSSSVMDAGMYADQIIGTLEIAELEIEHQNELVAGDRLVIVSAGEGQRYFVLDRIPAGGGTDGVQSVE
ncbi:DUF2577 family protein [Paenibacillus wulumuqiensis]|uniref:DUF2577 family protein n=1 Tax=Paenibacillus wulumuqiensis TaxID=1567107 RepID=UPI0006197AC0|nr:DUF2577 family protein [Paenibacillus wulumuqiensis]